MHLKKGFQKILVTDKKKSHRGGATDEPAKATALDPRRDHLSTS